MNKPAPKEPSMDEILSSIRQIIADDDAAAGSRKPAMQAAPPPMQATPAAPAAKVEAGPALADVLDEIEPLALSAEQILEADAPEDGGLSFEDILADTAGEAPPSLVDPDDIAFEAEEPDEAEAFVAALEEAEPVPAPEPARRPEPAAPAPSLPDPTLSSDMADQLLAPATNAAVRSTLSRLNALGLGTPGLTIEAMVREMLRPMLKEWLDENLPSVVERLVEKEIARISRGE